MPLLPLGTTTLLAFICATIPWATPSSSIVRALLLVSIKKLHLGLCRCSREQFLTFGIVLDRSLLRKHLSFLCVIFTSSFLVLLLWFQHSQLGRIYLPTGKPQKFSCHRYAPPSYIIHTHIYIYPKYIYK